MRARGSPLVVGAAFYAVAILVARQVVIPDLGISLIWPATGVAVVWFLLRDARVLSIDSLLFVVIGATIGWLTDAPWYLFLVIGPVSTLVQVHVATWLVRAWTPGLWGAGGERPLARTVDLGRFALACTLGSLAGSALGLVGFVVFADPLSPGLSAMWGGRSICGTVVLGLVGLLTCYWWSHGRPALVDLRTQGLELAVVLGLTAGLAVALYRTELPIAWTLILVTTWTALRFGPLLFTWHASAVAIYVIYVSANGDGPFAAVVDSVGAALVAQAFMTLVVLIGLAIAVGIEERSDLAEQTEEALRLQVRQARLLTAIVDAMGDGVAVLEAPHAVVLRNPATVDLFDVDLADGLHLLAPRILRPDGSRPTAEDSIAGRALSGESVQNDHIIVQRPDGTERTIRVSATHLAPSSPADPARAVLLFHDMTDDVERTKEIAAFARVVAHDLRNPLSAMGGWIGLLRQKAAQGDLSPEFVTRIATRLDGATTRLDEMVDGILQRATSTDRNLSLGRVELDDMVQRIVETNALEDVVHWSPGMPAVNVDALMVGQSLDNLISNAVKYVAPGAKPEVQISAQVVRPGWVAVRVADNGIGIPEGQHELVFDEFHRAHSSDYRGTGLGLSIARRVVTRHGGTITAMPHPSGRGTVFELTLPAG